ncbi:MAG TPA: hypothetical protein VN982_03505 [Candidatus Dormibacteraeota bacterium]|nr:hypothetical protein [Candidatus Dormibacteraeota bacterium]
MKNYLPLVLALAFVLTPSQMLAQTKNITCVVRFGIVHLDQRLPNGGISGMTKRQSDWFKKNGAKKFPSLCEDEAKPEYLILWTAEDASSVVGSSSGGNGSITTVQREKVTFYVVEGGKRDSQNALFSGENWDSLLHWADQSALADALKFLATRIKKN